MESSNGASASGHDRSGSEASDDWEEVNCIVLHLATYLADSRMVGCAVECCDNIELGMEGDQTVDCEMMDVT